MRLIMPYHVSNKLPTKKDGKDIDVTADQVVGAISKEDEQILLFPSKRAAMKVARFDTKDGAAHRAVIEVKLVGKKPDTTIQHALGEETITAYKVNVEQVKFVNATLADKEIDMKDAVEEATKKAAEAKEAEVKAKADEVKAKEDEVKAKADEVKAKEDEVKAKEAEVKAKEAEVKAKEAEVKAKEPEAKAKEPEAKASSLKGTFKKLAIPMVVAGSAGAAFFFGGGTPFVLAKAGVTLAGAGLTAATFGLPVVAGIAAAVASVTLWTAAKIIIKGISKKVADWKKSKKQHDEEDLKRTQDSLVKVEKTLGYKDDSAFVVQLADILNNAPNPEYDEKGNLSAKQPEAMNKVVLAHWQLDQVKSLVTKSEAERRPLEEQILQGPKPAPK